MGNRRKGDVWKYFRKVSQNAQGKAKVSCTFCGCTYLENATRMTTHLQKCSGYRKLHAIFTPETEQPGPSNYMTPPEGETLNYGNSFQNGILRHHFPEPLSSQQPTQQDSERRELLARAIFACGLPVGLVEEAHWKALFKSLDPNFILPTSTQLERGYLETEYCDLKAKIDKRIYESPCVGVICESTRNEDSINVFVSAPKLFFHKSLPKPSRKILSEDSLVIVDNLLHSLGKDKVVSMVTDKDSGFLESRKVIEEKYAYIAVYECLQEAVSNLLDQIFLQSENAKNVWRQVERLRSLLRDSLHENAHLSNHIIHYIVSSRSYNMPILSYIISSKLVITDHILTNESKTDSEVCKQYVNESEFWVKAEKLYHLVDPVANMLREFDNKPPPPLSHVVRIVKGFETHFETTLSDPYYLPSDRSLIHDSFTSFKDVLVHPIHLAADFLDPQSKGVSLSLNEQMLATEYIYKFSVFNSDVNDEDLLVDLANYKACDELWGKEYIWKAVHKLHPVSWWNGFCSSTNLSKIAVRIFNLPATMLYEKSIFSSYEYYEMGPTNPAIPPKVKEMLSYVSRNLKFLKEDISEPALARIHSANTVITQGDGMLCVPKTEKDQPNFESEVFDGYKFPH